MHKLLAALKKGLVRSVPLLLSGGVALLASPSFAHYVAKHPAVSAFVPAVAWLLHSVAHAKKTA